MSDQERLQQGYTIVQRMLDDLHQLHLLWIEAEGSEAADLLSRMAHEVQQFTPEVSDEAVLMRSLRRRIQKAVAS